MLWTNVSALLQGWVFSKSGGVHEDGRCYMQMERAHHCIGLHGTHRRCNNRDELQPGLFLWSLRIAQSSFVFEHSGLFGVRLLVSFCCCPVLNTWGNEGQEYGSVAW